MKTILLTLIRSSAVFFTLTLFASASSKEDISREIDTAPGGKLVVEVDFGSIDVAAGAENKVTLEAHRKIDFGSEAKEKEYLANSPITLSKEGDVVTIRSRGKREHWNFFGHCDMDARYIVHVPKKFTPTLRTDGGTISVTDIAGDVKAHTSGGRMAFARIEGVLDGETSGGAIELDDCKGPIDVETSGGRIKVVNSKGTLKARTSGGSIDVRDFFGDTEVRTSGGGLFLERIAGKLTGKTSGGGIRASIPGALVGDVKLETSAGGIELAVPASAAFTIDAKTSVGEVVSKLPIQTTDANREHLRGTVNGGGKSVRLWTSVGNITISAPSEVAQQ